MRSTPAENPVSGITSTVLEASFGSLVEPSAPDAGPALSVTAPASIFEHVVRIMHDNECLFSEQNAFAGRLGRARSYLAEPGCNKNLALANLLHLKTKHSAVLLQLRANRLEARGILDRLDPRRQ